MRARSVSIKYLNYSVNGRLLSLFAPLKPEGNPSQDNHGNRKEQHRGKTGFVLRGMHLLPDNEWKPDLKDIGHLIHASCNDSTLFIIISADFVSPSIASMSVN